MGYCYIYLYFFCIFWFGDVGDVLVCLGVVFVYVLLGFIDDICFWYVELIFVSFFMLLLVLDLIFWNFVKLDLMCLNILDVNLWLVLYFKNFDVVLFLKFLWFNFSWLCFDWRFCICFLRDVIVLFFELRVFFNLVMCWASDCIIIYFNF